jgi:hypothetical protein
VVIVEVKLNIDGKDVSLNKFVEKILGGTILGAVASLRGMKKDWKEIEIKIKK